MASLTRTCELLYLTNQTINKKQWRIPSSLGRHTPNTDSPKQQQGLMSYQDQLASVKSKTRKSVPFPVRSDQYEEEEQEESLSNLLDGEYDEKESHAAFQRALNEWRGVPTKEQEVKEVVDKVVKSNAGINANTGCNANTGTQSAKTPSVAESQLKDLLERSAMDKGLSYLDKLLLDKYRSESGVNKEDALDQKLEKLRSLSLNDQSELVLSQLNEPTWQEEEEEELNLHDESFPLVGFEGEEEFTIQDITQCTEDSIQESLKAGRMIEVLPSSVCTIEESSR